MSNEQTPPPVAPTVEPAVTKTEDNAAIRELRAHIAKLEADNKEKDAKLSEIEKAKLSELERLQLEKQQLSEEAAKLKSVEAENQAYSQSFEDLYKRELAGVPDDKKQQVETLTTAGNWIQRYQSLLAAKALLAPSAVGTVTQPSNVTPSTEPPAPQAKDLNDVSSLKNAGWAFKPAGKPQAV